MSGTERKEVQQFIEDHGSAEQAVLFLIRYGHQLENELIEIKRVINQGVKLPENSVFRKK